ncbi:MAG: hypothetical protein NVSMB9_21310 [Isosphaeraceae bacterium]
MDKNKRKALEGAGFQVGDAGDFLGLSAQERHMVELRLALSRAVRKTRLGQHLTQEQVATRIHSTQSRIAKIEGASSDVSLDLMFKGLFALGVGSVAGLIEALVAEPQKRKPRGVRRTHDVKTEVF